MGISSRDTSHRHLLHVKTLRRSQILKWPNSSSLRKFPLELFGMFMEYRDHYESFCPLLPESLHSWTNSKSTLQTESFIEDRFVEHLDRLRNHGKKLAHISDTSGLRMGRPRYIRNSLRIETDEDKNVTLKSKALYEKLLAIVAVDDPERIVVLQGVDNCIVAESDNVLLICKQDQEQRIKHFKWPMRHCSLETNTIKKVSPRLLYAA